MNTKHQVSITFPDQSVRCFDAPVSVMNISESISSGFARKTLAGKVNGRILDTSDLISENTSIHLITSDDDEGLNIIRKSTAHLLGRAVKQLFPEAKIVLAEAHEHGFYCDISYSRSFTEEDRNAIEERMKALASEKYDVVKQIRAQEDALTLFKERNEDFKVDFIDGLSDAESITLSVHEEYVDFSEGVQVPNSRFLSHFKLTKNSGVYLDGDANAEQLQRISGTAWESKKSLKVHLTMIEEAEKRDHRRLGKALGLFHFSEDAPGSVFWHAKGWVLFKELLNYMRRRIENEDYEEVNTPDLMDQSLWETSGHWQNYRDHMFSTETADQRNLVFKPMSCPGSVLLYGSGLKSYRDLPIRMAEFGKVHRFEPSGSLHGLLRVRHFTQDDAHIYCTQAQLQQECENVIQLVLGIYRDFGFEDVAIKLSTRPEKRLGDDATWDFLESSLIQSLKKLVLPYEINEGEGAFYGPKLEFTLRDSIGRDWQCGTLQVDMNLPERFDLSYTDDQGTRQPPVMLHRALFGSLERFIGILIEHYAGKFPAWLSPTQVAILSISQKSNAYAETLHKTLKKAGLRLALDNSPEKIGYKIRHSTLQKVPFMIVVGDKESDKQTVNIRLLNGETLGEFSVDDALRLLQEKVTAPDLL